MNRALLVVVLIGTLVSTKSVSAALITIDFDSLVPGTVLTNQFWGNGVRFALLGGATIDGPTIVGINTGSYPIATAPNAFTPGDDQNDPFFDVELTFSRPIDFLDIDVFDADEQLIVRGFLNGKETAATTFPPGSDLQHYDVTIGAIGGLNHFDRVVLDVVEGTSGSVLGGPELFDNLRYNVATKSITSISTADGNGADASVTGFDPIDRSNENHATRPNLDARWTPGSTGQGGSARFEKFWLRFDLPGDINAITNAKLDLYWNRFNALPRDFEVFGLLEKPSYGVNALTGESRLDENWGESQITWNNAPGNVDSLLDNELNSSNTRFLYSFDSPSSPQSISTPIGAARSNLVDFLNLDTDGLVTMMVRRPTASGVVGIFASKENSDVDVDAPRLVIEYSSIPEPSSVVAWALLPLMVVLYRFHERRRRNHGSNPYLLWSKS